MTYHDYCLIVTICLTLTILAVMVVDNFLLSGIIGRKVWTGINKIRTMSSANLLFDFSRSLTARSNSIARLPMCEIGLGTCSRDSGVGFDRPSPWRA